MSIKNKIEIARDMLNNAVKMNVDKDILLKISWEIDKYIVEYYHENGVDTIDKNKKCNI